jgi:antitoxin YefM
VVVSPEDWEREQETLFVLENRLLMDQIARSLQTHAQSTSDRS